MTRTPGDESPSVTDGEVAALLTRLDEGRQSWIEGTPPQGSSLEVEQAEGMTLFGPFGGEASRASADLRTRQSRAAGLFGGGTGRCEVVKTIVAGSVVVVVQVERNEARVEGCVDPQPWALRTTQVFELRQGGWVRLHRHADPLIDLRTPATTFAIARGE